MRQLNKNAIAHSAKDSLQFSQLRLLFNCDMEAATVQKMVDLAKQDFIKSHHKRSISEMQPNGNWKTIWYKTYVYEGDLRKEITASTKDKVLEKLYSFYIEAENKSKTLGSVFEMLMDYKQNCLNRKEKTIYTDKGLFKHVSGTLQETSICEITEETIQRFIVTDFLKTAPSQNLLKRLLELLDQIFEYGKRKKLCPDNPMQYIAVQDYYKFCTKNDKTDEEKAFSSEELARLRSDAQKNLGNPRVLISLLAEETGERVAELLALHKEDVDFEKGFIHIHRQQVKEGNKYVEVPYTKNEKNHPRNGRKNILTEAVKNVIMLALSIPGESQYLFHDPYCSEMVKKDGYLQNLRRRCKRLGCGPTNNHAFRMAFNLKLIDLGLNPSDRSLLLGHEVLTNETHYSLTDNRRLEDIKNRLIKKEP